MKPGQRRGGWGGGCALGVAEKGEGRRRSNLDWKQSKFGLEFSCIVQTANVGTIT